MLLVHLRCPRLHTTYSRLEGRMTHQTSIHELIWLSIAAFLGPSGARCNGSPSDNRGTASVPATHRVVPGFAPKRDVRLALGRSQTDLIGWSLNTYPSVQALHLRASCQTPEIQRAGTKRVRSDARPASDARSLAAEHHEGRGSWESEIDRTRPRLECRR